MRLHRTTASLLNLRAGPGTTHRVVSQLPAGTVVAEQTQWIYVETAGGVAGWISARHVEAVPPAPPPEPRWLTIARAELGQAEIPGPQHNPRIVAYHQTTALKATTDETPWCSSFVNWVMTQAGQRGTNSAQARSWLGWGAVSAPRLGSIVVLKRGAPPAGHVGFYLGREGDRIRVLSGNQSNAVRESLYPLADVLGHRWPG